MKEERCCKVVVEKNFIAPLYSAQKHCGMTNGAESDFPAPRHSGKFLSRIWARQNGGFTLIELLVVVLIIGILAAVAVPQYKMAVDKARLMKLVAMTKSVVEAEEAYYLANGTYTKDWDSLAVTLPGTVDSNAITFPDGQSVRLYLAVGGAVNGLTASDEKLSNVHIYAFYANNTLWPGVLACYAYRTDKRAVNLCKSFANNQRCRDGVKLCYYPYTDNG